MLDLGVVPHILTMLEQHVDEGDVSVQHAGLSALRNLAIPGTGPVKAAPQHQPSNLLAFMSKVFMTYLVGVNADATCDPASVAESKHLGSVVTRKS